MDFSTAAGTSATKEEDVYHLLMHLTACGPCTGAFDKIRNELGQCELPPIRIGADHSTEGQSKCHEPATVDLRKVYWLVLNFLAEGPCIGAFWELLSEVLEHKLLPLANPPDHFPEGGQRDNENYNGKSFPLSWGELSKIRTTPHIPSSDLKDLLKKMFPTMESSMTASSNSHSRILTGADVPTFLRSGIPSLLHSEQGDGEPSRCNQHMLRSSRTAATISNFPSKAAMGSDKFIFLGCNKFSLHDSERCKEAGVLSGLHQHVPWSDRQTNPVQRLMVRELGRVVSGCQRPCSAKTASYAIASPTFLFQRINLINILKGHSKVIYCAVFDRNAQFVITGADDGLVKIWSTRTGFCLRSCLGHLAGITDLAVSRNNQFVASASDDCSIRVWRIPDGFPVSVLRGHGGAVTAIAFSPRHEYEYHLLSCCEDGICRIWDARNSAVRPQVYMPSPKDAQPVSRRRPRKASLQVSSISSTASRVLCCAFNALGTVFVTGYSDYQARVWSATTCNLAQRPNYELDTLEGHEKHVCFVQFSGYASGRHFVPKEDYTTSFQDKCSARDSIVTCSRDGTAIIWTPLHLQQSAEAWRWVKAFQLRAAPHPIHSESPRPGVRKRSSVRKSRSINIIIWSLDSRFLLGAIRDCRICVWNSQNGSLAHSLNGHVKQIYVLDVHPFNPQIAMSAGYDGRVIIWDIWGGRLIRIYETGDHCLVDGSFSHDGSSVVVSDNMGQIYLFATGDGSSQRDAKYAQFFLKDYVTPPGDFNGNVQDLREEISAFLGNIRDDLCDERLIPYSQEYLSMYQQERLSAMGIKWNVFNPDGSEMRDASPPGVTGSFQPQVRPLSNIEDRHLSDTYWSDSDSADSDYSPSPKEIEIEEIELKKDDEDQTNVVVPLNSRIWSEEDEEDSDDEGFQRMTHLSGSTSRKGKAELQTTASPSRCKTKRHHGWDKEIRISSSSKRTAASSSTQANTPLVEQYIRPKRQAAINAASNVSKILEEEDRAAEFQAIYCSPVERSSGSLEPQTVLQRGVSGEPVSPYRAEQSAQPDNFLRAEQSTAPEHRAPRNRFRSLSSILKQDPGRQRS